MFDVGFLEMVVIMVLGLLVLGPERLPKAARKVGYWFGKTRRYVESMKTQVESEFDTSEFKRMLHNQDVQIRELQNKITDTDALLNDTVKNEFDEFDDPGNGHNSDADQYDDRLAQAEMTQKKQAVEADVKPSGPQYDIIENESAWNEPVESSIDNLVDNPADNKTSPTATSKESDKV